MNLNEKSSRAAEAIKAADALLITAGAGMGVDSGLPDFRGTEGFWNAYPVVARLGLSFEDLADPSWFEKSPNLAWALYGHRLNLYRSTRPHDGFAQLLELGSKMPSGYFVFTSNVDGQFQKAGFAPERIVECHGSIHHFQCVTPCADDIWDASREIVNVNDEVFRALDPLPGCRSCAALARPNILMFGDGTWLPGRSGLQQALFDEWLERVQNSSARLAVIELGAGTSIPTVRLASEAVVRRLRGTLIRINLREDSVPSGQIGLLLSAVDGIRRIYERLRGLAGITGVD